QIITAAYYGISSRAIAAAISAAPRRPSRLIDWDRRGRFLEHLGIRKRDLGWHNFPLGRQPERGVVSTTNPAAPIDERIEHQVEELVHELECDTLRAGCDFTVELIERPGQTAATQLEDGQEIGRQRASAARRRAAAARRRAATAR